MMDTVKKRLKSYIESKKISQRAFELSVGLSNGYVNSIRNSIQPDKVERISLRFPDLNTGWLLTGEGEMLKPSSQPEPPAVSVAVSDDVARLLGIIESQQRVIESQAQAIKILSEK